MYLTVGTALSFALHCTCGRCHLCLGDRDSSMRQKVQVSSSSQVSETNLHMCDVPESSLLAAWLTGDLSRLGTLTLVWCPQLILCFCRFLDLHRILQAGGLGGMTGMRRSSSHAIPAGVVWILPFATRNQPGLCAVPTQC